MATKAEIQDLTDQIDSIWDNPPARDGLFGNMLRSVGIRGIRGLYAQIDFRWPVTAIAGTNGSGKTTFLQVASAAYARERGGRQIKLGSWIRGALQGDTPPVQTPAAILYTFVDNTPSFEVAYIAARTRWNYPRRGNPNRNVEFIGITTYAPRVEKRDRLHHARGNVQVVSSQTADIQVTQSISRILGTPYSALNQQTVRIFGKYDDEVPQIRRGVATYSEPHMGAGEQKVIRLVQTIESMPNRSLILLEEPELTLHPDAQIGLAWYLMAISRRKGHQILLATHSEHLFQALPRQARVMLVRSEQGLQVLYDVTNLHAARELTNSMRTNAPLIIVEDDAARAFLRELFRQVDLPLHRDSAVVSVGNDDDVRRLTTSLRRESLTVVGVRDGDRGEDPGSVLYSLPGGAAPETVLLADDNITRANSSLLAGAQDAFRRASPVGQGHPPSERDKRILSQMARELNMEADDLASRLTQTWLLYHREEGRNLVSRIRAGLESA